MSSQVSLSTYSPGNITWTIPANAINVNFTIAGAGGGGSNASSVGQWYHALGGSGRAGNFTIATRSYEYSLLFQIGSQGGMGVPGNGGYGGASPVASGGRGHNSGGGGGGASAVYDYGLNKYIAWMGGGGGAGRFHADTSVSGVGVFGAGIGGGRSSIRGLPNWKNGGSAGAGHRGGGGGGSNAGVFGGNGGISTTTGHSGTGGNSGWYDQGDVNWITNSGYGSTGGGYGFLSYTLPPPGVDFRTANNSPSIFIAPGLSTNISWDITGAYSFTVVDQSGLEIANQGNKSYNDFTSVSPAVTNVYSLTATGSGGNTSKSVTVGVYTKPEIIVSTNPESRIITLGQQASMQWTVLGDATTLNITPGFGGVNLSGSIPITPTTTTTYTLVASGLGGSDSVDVTFVVQLPPTVSVTGPAQITYGDNLTLNYDATNVTTSFQLLASYDGGSFVFVQDLPVGEVSNGSLPVTPPYNNQGPTVITYQLYGVGDGGLIASDDITIGVGVDITPGYVYIPPSEDKIADEQPVITPDAEITSEQILIDDIDIPVEIQSDYPIQVEIDNSGVFVNIREMP